MVYDGLPDHPIPAGARMNSLTLLEAADEG
jgi:hypothetical protein